MDAETTSTLRASDTVHSRVRWPAHELDRCNHIFQQRSCAVVWASDNTGLPPPPDAPTVIDEECILCGAWRQRWL